MSKGIVHRIIYQPDGESFAIDIEDFFMEKFNLQFELKDLETVSSQCVSSMGVCIVLLTTQSYEYISCGKRSDLKELFPNPDFSIALLYLIDKSHHEVTQLLAHQTRNFERWTILECRSHSQLISLCRDIMALVVMQEGKTFRTSPPHSVRVWPRVGVKAHQQLMLIFNERIDEEAKVNVIQTWDNVKHETQRFNSMNYSFTIGDVKAEQIKLAVFVNDTIYGRLMLHVMRQESKMEQISKLVNDVINPVELLCNALCLDSKRREDLDRKLIELIPDNISSLDKVFNRLDWGKFGETDSNHELPTLLHFGAKYGLYHFCMRLLTFPGGKQALEIKNKNGLFPHEIADEKNFRDLAFDLRAADESEKMVQLRHHAKIAKTRCSEITQGRGVYYGLSILDSGFKDMISEDGGAHENEVDWKYRSLPSHRVSSRRTHYAKNTTTK